MNKKLVLLFTIVGVLLIIWLIKSQQYTISRGELIDLLEQGETTIDLTEVADFEWVQVDAFGPYSTTDVVENAMGISIRFGGIDVTESQFLLIFANDKEIVASVSLNRKYGDYSVQDNRYLMVEKR
ncbi:MAG: hypothetical protein ABS948_08280 [Solibacillus sp.]